MHAASGFANAFALTEKCVDCGKFHSISTEFDLSVNPAEIFNVSTWREPSQIASSINATEFRMDNKFFCSDLGSIAISTRKSNPTDTEFAFTSNRNLAQSLIDNAYGVAFNRSTDCDCDARINPSANDGHSAFSWAISIFKSPLLTPKICKILWQRFATDINQFQKRQRARWVFASSRSEQRWGRAEDRNAFIIQPRHEVGTKSNGFVIEKNKRCANSEGEPSFFER